MKLPGVESAEVSLDKASADIHLKADNNITMPQLREVLKKNGYPTRDAQIEARGKIVDAGGTLTFDLLNGATMVLVLDPKGVPVRPGPQAIEITGVSRADGKAAEKLALTEAGIRPGGRTAATLR
jgi:copper chaperone CopZ